LITMSRPSKEKSSVRIESTLLFEWLFYVSLWS
jgi:hypothetical protein